MKGNMQYYFWVKPTDKHDRELEIIEAQNYQEAVPKFIEMHPEDADNIESITEEDSFMPMYQSSTQWCDKCQMEMEYDNMGNCLVCGSQVTEEK